MWIKEYNDNTVKYPYTMKDLKLELGISIPETGYTMKELNKFGVYELELRNLPVEKLSRSKEVYRGAPQKDDSGWFQLCSVVDRKVEDLMDSNGVIVETAEEQILKYDKENLSERITDWYEDDSEPSIVYNSAVFYGGEDSGSRILMAKQLVELAGLPSMSVTDKDRVAHTMSIDEVEELLLLIGMKAQEKFLTKQRLLVAVSQASSTEELNTIHNELAGLKE